MTLHYFVVPTLDGKPVITEPHAGFIIALDAFNWVKTQNMPGYYTVVDENGIPVTNWRA